MTDTRRLVLGASLLLSLCSCDVWGRRIVDVKWPEGQGVFMCTDRGAACEPLSPVVPLVPSPAPMSACTGERTGCDASQTVLSSCDLETSAAAFALQSRELSCVKLVLALPSDAPSLLLRDLTVTGSTLVFVAEQPIELVIAHALLKQVQLELRGPIQLSLTEKSELRNTQLTDTGTQAASVSLIESFGEALSTVGLRGSFRATRANLRGASLFAREVELETTTFSDLELVADQLFVADVRGKRATMELSAGTLAGAEIDRLTLQRCDSVLITKSTLTGAALSACTDKLRIDNSVVRDGKVVGRLESHVTTWENNVIGHDVASELESWTDSLRGNHFCPQLRRLTLSRPTTMSCNDCSEAAPPSTELFCIVSREDMEPVDVTGMTVRNPGCVALDVPLECLPEPVDENPF